MQESNLRFQSQNLVCYHYTNQLETKADSWTRTCDLLITNQLRYQLRHVGIKMTVRFGLTVAELQSAALDHLATSSSGGRFPHVSYEGERRFTEPSEKRSVKDSNLCAAIRDAGLAIQCN